MERVAADIPEPHKRALLEHALANDRSLAQELRRAVRLYVTMLERDRTSGQAIALGSSSQASAPSSAA